MSACKSCGAGIRWVKTPAGKMMPLDDKAKTLWLIDGDSINAPDATARPVQVRESHFSTCPNADEHRRAR